MTLCLDTTALVEIQRQNSTHAFILEEQFCIPELLLAEFYGVIYRQHNEKTAEYWCKRFLSRTVPVNLTTLLHAAKLKEDNKKERLSFFDCVGYCYAIEHGMRFVTSDAAFKGKKGVVYVGN